MKNREIVVQGFMIVIYKIDQLNKREIKSLETPSFDKEYFKNEILNGQFNDVDSEGILLLLIEKAYLKRVTRYTCHMCATETILEESQKLECRFCERQLKPIGESIFCIEDKFKPNRLTLNKDDEKWKEEFQSTRPSIISDSSLYLIIAWIMILFILSIM